MNKNKPKVLIYDIETTPIVSYTWGIWEQNVIKTKEEWYILSCAYKWLGKKKTHVLSLPDHKSYKKNLKDDSKLVKDIWKLFDEADILIAHNGDQFDVKKVQARFIQHNLPPPTPFKTIDTKKVAKRYFKFDSNRLDSLGEYFNVGRKIKHQGFSLWLGCMNGEDKAWKSMCKYNIQDVILLEKVYLKMLPYMTSHPNLNLLNGTSKSCPNCSSHNTIKRGFNITRASKFQRFQCKDCGAWSQGSSIKIEKVLR